MSTMLLQVNFTFNVTRAEYEGAVGPLADSFAALDGLVWKVWIMNEEAKEAGGIYLFKDDASMQAYLQGPLAEGVINHPALSDFSVKQFEVMGEISEVTRGPI